MVERSTQSGANPRRDRGWNAASIVILVTLWILAIIHITSLAKSLQYENFPCDFCSFYSSDLALRAGLDPARLYLPCASNAGSAPKAGYHHGPAIRRRNTCCSSRSPTFLFALDSGCGPRSMRWRWPRASACCWVLVFGFEQ